MKAPAECLRRVPSFTCGDMSLSVLFLCVELSKHSVFRQELEYCQIPDASWTAAAPSEFQITARVELMESVLTVEKN